MRSWPRFSSGISTFLNRFRMSPEFLRQRIEVPQVGVRHGFALGLHVVHGRGAGAVGAAPAEDEQVAAGGAVDFLRRECRWRCSATFAARVLTMC